MTLLALEAASAGYQGRTVLRDVTLDIARGERIALVGESGAGKSTLLRLLYERAAGAAALIPQDLGLVESLSVFHNVYMGRLDRSSALRNLRNLLWPDAAEVARVADLLVTLRLEDKIFARVGELSGGQQQRTAVGRALYRGADILLADEPVSSVDEHQAREILSALSRACETVVVALHDRALALDFADRVVGLKDGAVVLDMATLDAAPSALDHLYVAGR